MLFLEDEEVRITAGVHKHHKKALFLKYIGKASCVIKQIHHPNPNFWTVRLTSIKNAVSLNKLLLVDNNTINYWRI